MSQLELSKAAFFGSAVDGFIHHGFGGAEAFETVVAAPYLPPRRVSDATREARHEADLGQALYDQGRFDEALARYARAIEFEPSRPSFHYQYACAAWKKGETAAVAQHLKQCLRLDSRFVRAHQAMAFWHLQQNDHDSALKHATAAAAIDPNSEETGVAVAEVLIAMGRLDDAGARLRPLVDRGCSSVYLARAVGRLAEKTGREGQAIAVIERALSTQRPAPLDEAQLHGALFPLLQKLKRYDQAFHHARRAKEITRRRHDPDALSNAVTQWMNYFTPRQLRDLPRATHGSDRPIFIVGMPRSGTSLVEQILASHPDVFGAGELTAVSDLVQPGKVAAWSGGQNYPQCFDHLSVARANRMAEAYLRNLAARNSTARYVTDKMPDNWMHLGVIQMLFPRARVIHCRRDPRDSGLSCYTTMFLGGQPFSHDLSHIAKYYRDYDRMMGHWRSTLDLPILDVQYESMVADQEGQSRRLLQFLNLRWDDRCLNFHETARPVATASHEQVRRPMYRSSVGRWKHYARHIPELMALA